MSTKVFKLSAELQELVELAAADPYLGEFIYQKKLEDIFPLRYGPKVVGFCIPREEKDGRWRTGPIFVREEYRGKGISQTFIRVFFKDRKGRSWIDSTNVPSHKAFTKAGFHRSGKWQMATGCKMYEYLKD